MLKIENGKYEVKINPMGAELSGLYGKAEKTEYMWQGIPEIWSGRSPILFPVVGRLKDDKYIYEGKEYKMPKHGFVRKELFKIKEQSEDSLTLTYKDYKKYYEAYPFEYEFSVKFEVTDKGVKVTHIVENLGDKDMYFSLGAHPGIECGKGAYLEFPETESVRAYRFNDDKIIKEETDEFLPGTNIFKIYDETFVDDAYVLEGLKSAYVIVKAPELNRSVKVDFGGAPYLGVWAKPAAPYVCIEPWFGLDDDVFATGKIEEKKGIVKLPTKETFKFAVTIEPQY